MMARGSRVAAMLAAVLVGGCGLRSEPLTVAAGRTDADRSSCGAPIDLPFEDGVVVGTLSHGAGSLESWCGGDEGREAVYRLRPSFTADISLAFVPDATDFAPTLRVERGACDQRAVRSTLVCAADLPLDDAWHFLAEHGDAYFIVVDTPGDEAGAFTFALTVADAPLEQCVVHPEPIELVAGGAPFTWTDTLEAGQGHMDGVCGGVGREHMFALHVQTAGVVTLSVDAVGMQPIVNLRTGCGGATQLACRAADSARDPSSATLSAHIPAPGTYYVVVDQAERTGGGYTLQAVLEASPDLDGV